MGVTSEREALLAQQRDAQAEIDAAYWRFTRCAKGVPPSSAVPDAYRRRKEAKDALRRLRGPRD